MGLRGFGSLRFRSSAGGEGRRKRRISRGGDGGGGDNGNETWCLPLKSEGVGNVGGCDDDVFRVWFRDSSGFIPWTSDNLSTASILAQTFLPT